MKNVAHNERSIKELVARAKETPDRHDALRRGTLERLVGLTQSPIQSLKTLAAQNIPHFFGDFADLEEDSINAIYDICEDPSVKVRLQGYSALVCISKENPHLVRRNADVLVQLLQSGEPEEVIAVKEALLHHLNIDSATTLRVLCDQIVPPNELQDEVEPVSREQLRSLVLGFLSGDAKRAIVDKHAKLGSEGEKILVGALIQDIPKLDVKQVELIIEDILLSLDTFKSQSVYGPSLLDSLLAKTILALHDQKQPTIGASAVLPFLDLASFVALSKEAAPALPLLQFYCRNFNNKFVLQKFNKEDQQNIVCQFVEILSAALQSQQHGGAPVDSLKHQVIDCSPLLLEALAISSMSRTRHVKACETLLQAIKKRKDTLSWEPPSNLTSEIQKISVCLEAEGAKLPQIQQLIRSLAQPPPRPSIGQGRNAAVVNLTPAPTSYRGGPMHQGPRTKFPKRPSSALVPDKPPTVAPRPLPFVAGSSRHTVIPTEPFTERPPKRPRSDMGSGPSLLERLGNSSSPLPPSRANHQVRPKVFAQQQSGDSLGRSNGGLSIKGAAVKRDPDYSNREGERQAPTSLLDRIGDSHAVKK